MERRPRLARGHRLDPPRPAADRALGEDREGPISAVERTCVPPQSSVETSLTSTTRTTSPYFSPKRAIAPSARASSSVVSNVCTAVFANTARLTSCSIRSRSSPRQLARVGEVEAELVGPHGRAGLRDVVAEHLAERRLEQMRGRVVRHRREADAPRDDRADAIAGGEALAAKDERLVAVEPVRVDELGPRPGVVVALDPALVGDLAAARGVERRLPQLREERAVAELLERAELREHVGLLVADEVGREPGARREVGRALPEALLARRRARSPGGVASRAR